MQFLYIYVGLRHILWEVAKSCTTLHRQNPVMSWWPQCFQRPLDDSPGCCWPSIRSASRPHMHRSLSHRPRHSAPVAFASSPLATGSCGWVGGAKWAKMGMRFSKNPRKRQPGPRMVLVTSSSWLWFFGDYVSCAWSICAKYPTKPWFLYVPWFLTGLDIGLSLGEGIQTQADNTETQSPKSRRKLMPESGSTQLENCSQSYIYRVMWV